MTKKNRKSSGDEHRMEIKSNLCASSTRRRASSRGDDNDNLAALLPLAISTRAHHAACARQK